MIRHILVGCVCRYTHRLAIVPYHKFNKIMVGTFTKNYSNRRILVLFFHFRIKNAPFLIEQTHIF